MPALINTETGAYCGRTFCKYLTIALLRASAVRTHRRDRNGYGLGAPPPGPRRAYFCRCAGPGRPGAGGIHPEASAPALEKAHSLRSEYVIAVTGTVQPRPEGTVNPDLATGEIEVHAQELYILNEAQTPPFDITERKEVAENLRLKYRFLDLRRPSLQKIFILRHRICQIIRNYLSGQGFLEVETPLLTKSTPEGARDYLVPSRIEAGNFYALPQSPQLFKQILMVAGFDRYFQIVKCFRDEDLRADRQPEFTQVDMEMSFIGEEDIYGILEGLMQRLFREILSLEIKTPFPRLSYQDAMNRFGVDKPDTRFGLELSDLTEALKSSRFKVFARPLKRAAWSRASR